MSKIHKFFVLVSLLSLIMFIPVVFAACSQNDSSINSQDTQNNVDNNSNKREEKKDPNIVAQEEVIKQYYKYVNDCNTEGMLSVCDTNSNNIFDMSYSLLQFLLNSNGKNDVNVRRFFMSLLPSMKGFLNSNNSDFKVNPTSIDVSEVDKSHSTATVMIDIEVSAQGQTSKSSSREELELVKEGNQWKINIEEACRDAVSSGIDLGLGLFGF